jgi:hypothetical protein
MSLRPCASLLLAVFASAPVAGAVGPLRAETVTGWDGYVRATETRIARELSSADGFFAMDFSPSRQAERAALASGEVSVDKVSTVGADGREMEVPEAMVHHWRGSVLVPGASLDEVLAQVADPDVDHPAQDDVVSARVLERGPGSLRLFLRLQRSQLVTVVYNTEHAVRYSRLGRTRASSRSIATRIAEVAEPSTPRERERRPGEDRGFLWRLNSYWRYEQTGAGVLVECESISLSRTVPALARGVVRPVIDQVARGSMERTLLAMRSRFTRAFSQGG